MTEERKMNPKIKEFMDAAYDKYIDPIDNEECFGFNREKFALLIIKECARVAYATECPDYMHIIDPAYRQGISHSWDMACVKAGNDILKHFDIK